MPVPVAETLPPPASNCSDTSSRHRDVDDRAASSHDGQAYKPRVLDPHLAERYLIDAAAAQELNASGQLTIVDVRSASAFDAYRIPGSINIPVHALKTKTFLKSHRLVLVNEGRVHGELLQTCQQLADAGFRNVSAMNGGLGAWNARGGALAGNASAARALSRMSPREFLVAQGERRWVILDATSGNASSWSDFGSPTVVPYTVDGDLGATLKFLQLDSASQASGPAILAVTDRGEGLARIGAYLTSQGMRNAYYLEGGMEGYQDYLTTRQSLLARVARGPTPGARCGGS